jgi:glutamate-5-semialdehyde dehydrogenase
MQETLQKVKKSKTIIAGLSGVKKTQTLLKMAEMLRQNSDKIKEANAADIEYAKSVDLSSAMVDRLFLDDKRIEAMAGSIEQIAALKDPVGRVLEGWQNPNGLRIEKVSVPIGVICVIYESRPNVTSDVAALCFKSGNACVLRGGKEAVNSNKAIAKALSIALESQGLPSEAITLLPDVSREGILELVKEDKYLDLVIPRGGEALIKAVNDNATVPVVKHDKGLCHLYVDESANEEMAVRIAINAKTQRPGVCNSIETLLIHSSKVGLLAKLKTAFDEKATRLKGCAKTAFVLGIETASKADFDTEYLDNILNIKLVDSVNEAIEHIAKYGSSHSDSIITESYANAEKFLNEVDSACVYVNASTRFTDGSEFGFGAEVGISTNKLHSRGPMGINDLTTYKFKIYGQGQVRA